MELGSGFQGWDSVQRRHCCSHPSVFLNGELLSGFSDDFKGVSGHLETKRQFSHSPPSFQLSCS